MNEFIQELLDTLDQTTADPATKLSVLELIQKHTAKDQEQPPQDNNLLTAAEWNGLGYKQRVDLYNSNREAYDAATQGNFKEVSA